MKTLGTMKHRGTAGILLLFVVVFVVAGNVFAKGKITDKGFDDRALTAPESVPSWFKLSFLDIREDIDEARASGKKGLIIYYGQKFCPYCKAFLKDNFGRKDIVAYTRKHFDVIEVDTRGGRLLKGLDGREMPENEHAIAEKANFTPTLIFYDETGKKRLRLVGYYSPYRFRAALEFVADKHFRKYTFKAFLEKANILYKAEDGGLARRTFIMNPPVILARKPIPAKKPLLVLFEQGKCHACDVLHSGVLSKKSILKVIKGFDVAQLDIWSTQKLIRPDGKPVTARQWANQLGIIYTPTLVFFSEDGREIVRIGSIVQFNRLSSVLRYISSKAYLKYKSYPDWQLRR